MRSPNCKVTEINKQTEQRCGVQFEGYQKATTSDQVNNWIDEMNPFRGFFESVWKVRSEQTCCSDSSDLRYQPNRYSTIRVDVEFRALAVRHGGLNGYQGH